MQERNLKEVLQKKEESTIKQKMELLYEEILDDLLVNQKSLTKTERVKLFVTLSGYILPKNKPVEENNKPENPTYPPSFPNFRSRSINTSAIASLLGFSPM